MALPADPAALAYALMNSLFLAVESGFVAPLDAAGRLPWLAVVWALALGATALLLVRPAFRRAAVAAAS